jgi:autotransporter passenger strand-loop-strand repeat protein
MWLRAATDGGGETGASRHSQVSEDAVVSTITVSSGTTVVLSQIPGSTDYIVEGSGALVVANGGAVSGLITISSGGSANVSSGSTVLQTTIDSGGFELVYEGLAVRTTISNGGLQDVDAGLATLTTIGNGGTQNVYGGTARNTTISGGGSQVVYDGGTAGTTFVRGNMQVSSGGIAIITELYEGGLQYVYSGGSDIGAAISSAAEQYVFGTDISTTINRDGIQRIDGGTASGTTISSGGSQVVEDGGIAVGAKISGGGSQLVYDGGTASGATIGNGGASIIGSGGFARGMTIGNGGLLEILSGGTADSTVESGGTQLDYGLASGTTAFAGAQVVESGDTASGTILSGGSEIVSAAGTDDGAQISGGKQNVYGDASGVTVFTGSQVVESGATTSGTVVSFGLETSGLRLRIVDGTEIVSKHGTDLGAKISGTQFDYGLASGATVFTGAQVVESGGIASGTILSGGSEIVSARGTDDGAQISGGEQIVYGSASGVTVFTGTQVVESGGEARGTIVSFGLETVGLHIQLVTGTEIVSAHGVDLGAKISGTQSDYGLTIGDTVFGGAQVVESGGTASGTTLSGGSEIVSAHGVDVGAKISGGTQFDYGSASDATIAGGGAQLVESGGTATSTTVGPSGTQVVEPGGKASGTEVVSSGGSATLSGGTIGSGATVEALNGGTVIVSDTVTNGGRLYASGSGSLIEIASGAVVNGGVVEVGNGIVEIAGSSSENVIFQSSGSGGLQLDELGSAYKGKISEFGPPDGGNDVQNIDFTGVDFAGAAVTYTSANTANTSGTLSVTDGVHSASVLLVGHYVTSDFQAENIGGALAITDPTTYITSALTIANGKTIVASGGDFIAESTVTVDGAFEAENANDVEVQGALTNSGTTETTSASDMNLESTVSNASTGLLIALAASDITIQGAFVNSGTAEATNTAVMAVEGALTNAGNFKVLNTAVMDVDSNVTNSSMMEAFDYGQIFLDVSSAPTATLVTNDGTIEAVDNALIDVTPGDGAANTGLINNGIIANANGSSEVVLSPDGKFTNNGTIEADAGFVGCYGLLLNQGTIGASGSGDVYIQSLSNNPGVLKVTGTGEVEVGLAANGGVAQIDGTGTLINYLKGTSGAIDEIRFDNSSNVNVSFGTGDSGILYLFNSSAFTGDISGFTTGDGIDLHDIAFDPSNNVQFVADDTGGTLNIYNGSADLIDSFTFVGLDPNGGGTGVSTPYASANFSLVRDHFGGTLIEDPSVTLQHPGNAPALIGDGTIFEINTPDSGNVSFTGSTGKLVLDQQATFTGTVKGFGAQNGIDLSQITFGANTTLGYSENRGDTGGTLTVSDGAHTASVTLVGNYIAASFVTVGDQHGGTLVSNALETQPAPLLTHPHT